MKTVYKVISNSTGKTIATFSTKLAYQHFWVKMGWAHVKEVKGKKK